MAVDSKKIIEIASKLPVESNEKGIMAAFGVYAAMNYNEFFFKVVSQAIHGMNTHTVHTIEKKLYDAVLECGYHTFHGIRSSMHWREYIKPLIASPEDEVAALVAVTNIFGIGYIEVEELVPGERLVTVVKNAYDPGRYRDQFGRQPYGRCYMFSACTASYMDLVYSDPYPSGMGMYHAREVTCRAAGDPICRFIAEREKGDGHATSSCG